MRSVITGAVLMAAAITATAAPSLADDEDSGVRGRVTYGPVPSCGAPQPGVRCNRPYRATIRIRRRGDDDVIRRVRSNRQGRFRVELEPGRYVLDPVNKHPFPRAERQRVHVRNGEFIKVHIHYASGIS